KIVDRYEREKDVVVYYDPDQPLTGVLEPGITGGALFIFGLGLCFTSVLGIGIPYVVFKGRYADS
ncbi:MAG: hypothetical protein KAG66_24810, partial [Methylococcales bacterium]|nr:hypothetical protein [Methylococcales bacterium]